MISVCLSENFLPEESICEVVNEAILGFVDYLNPEDFLCINIGNSQVMNNDA